MSVYRPQRPAYDTALELYTYQDAVDHLAETFDTQSRAIAQRRALRAVREAYRDLPGWHEWSYLQRRGQIVTAASQSTGTIAYDHTGGTYERMVTLSGATFPTNARNYKLLIDGTQYKIQEFKTTTVVTLTEDSNPGADVAAGTSYTLFRSEYDLPADFRVGTQLAILDDSDWPQYAPPAEVLAYQAYNYQPQEFPRLYTIRNAGDGYSGLVVEFAPPPSSSKTYDFMYSASMRPIRPFGQNAQYTTGTVSVSGTTVTGSNTAFAARMVGSVIRFSSNATTPSGYVGADGDYQPFEEQRIVTAVASATSLTIDAALSGTYSGVAYSISDPIDIEPQVMYTPLLRLAEWRFALASQHPQKEVSQKYGWFLAALKDAMGQDYRNGNLNRQMPVYPVYTLNEPDYS